MLRSSVVAMALAAIRLAGAATLTEVLEENKEKLGTLIELLGTVPEFKERLSEMKNVTILAPDNEAFQKIVEEAEGKEGEEEKHSEPELLEKLLEYHVINGTFKASDFGETPSFPRTLLEAQPFTNVTSGGQHVELSLVDEKAAVISGLRLVSRVVESDIEFEGGVLHVIDTVLDIPPHVSTAAVTAGLSSVSGLLSQTNLIGTLDSIEDLTIFAPNNEALAAIGSLTNNMSNVELSNILRYHIIRGKVAFSPSLQVEEETQILTLAGEMVTIRSEEGEVYVNQAKVVLPDVLVGSGVVHVVDSVLNPAAPKLEPEGESEEPAVAFEGAEPVEGESGEEEEGEGEEENANSAAPRSFGLPRYSLLSLLAGAAAFAHL